MNKKELASNFLKKSVKTASGRESDASYGIIYNNIASLYYSKEAYDKAIEFSKKTLDLVEEEVVGCVITLCSLLYA